MDSRKLLAIIALLEADGIDVWLDGGWGVDALLEHQTREHDDLDLVVELEHASRVIELLESLGYFLVAELLRRASRWSIRAGARSTFTQSPLTRAAGVSIRWMTARSGCIRAKGSRVEGASTRGRCAA